MSIFKGDFSEEGYNLGLDDATKGVKPVKKGVKFHWEMFKKGFRILNHNQAMATFSKGYELGFLDGLRKREGLYGNKKTEITKKTKAMSNTPDNLKKQIELLYSFDTFLSNIQSNLSEVSVMYGNIIKDLYESGLVKEYADKLNEINYAEFKAKISSTNNWIEDNDKKYAKKVIGQVNDAIK